MWDEVQFLFIRWDGQMMNYYETNKLHRLLGENKEDRWDIKTDYNNEYQITLTMKEPVYSTNIEKYIKKVECRLKEMIAKLNQILTGYYHYYGITDNTESITAFRYNIMRSLFYCLNRRSQTKSYNWVEFLNMLDNSYPLVRPRIYVNIYE